MFVTKFLLILLFQCFQSTYCDDVHLLKDYFTSSLIEENREILSHPLTVEIEQLIQKKVDGFMSLIGKPEEIPVNSRSKREISDNNESMKEESLEISVLKGFNERASVPIDFAEDICLFEIEKHIFAVGLSHNRITNRKFMKIFLGNNGGFEEIHEYESNFLTAIDCISVENEGFVAVVNSLTEIDTNDDKQLLLQHGSFVLRIFISNGTPKVEVAQEFAKYHQNGVRLWARDLNLYLVYTLNSISENNICAIFKLTGTHFNPIDSLPCQNAKVIEFFTVHSHLMVFIGNDKQNNGTSALSPILRYDLSQKKFVEYQTIYTPAITTAKYFFLDHHAQRQHFLFIGNSFEIDELGVVHSDVNSIIYKYNNDFFVPMQLINLKHVQSVAPLFQQKGNEEFYLLVASKDNEIQIFSYDGWKFLDSSIDFTGDAFSAGVTSIRTYDSIIHGTTTIVISNENLYGNSFSIYSPVYSNITNTEVYKSKIANWCKKATKRMESFDFDETLEALQSSLDMRDSEKDRAKFLGKVSMRNSTIQSISTSNFKGKKTEFTTETATRVNDLANRQSKLQIMAKHMSEKIKFTMATGRRIRRQAPSPLVKTLLVEEKLNVETINGIKIDRFLHSSNLRNNNLKEIIAKNVTVGKDLFVNNKIDDIEFSRNNLLLNQPEQVLRPFQVDNLTLNLLFEVEKVNNISFQEFFDLMRKKNNLKLPTKFNSINAKKVIIENEMNGRNFSGIVKNSLKLVGDQEFIAPVKLEKLQADNLNFFKVIKDQNISNIPIIDLIDINTRGRSIEIDQDIQFANDVEADNLIVTQRINNINVKDRVLQVLRKAGNMTKQIITGEKFFNKVKLMSPIVLRGKINSSTLEIMNPVKIVDKKLQLVGDFEITGPVKIRKFINASNDIKTTDPNYSLKRLGESGLNLFTTTSSKNNFNFKNVIQVAGNLKANSLNEKIVDNFVKSNFPGQQKIEALTKFRNSLLVRNGEVQGEKINNVDILQLDKTVLKKSHVGTQFISGNFETISLKSPLIISRNISFDGQHYSQILSKSRKQQIKKLIVGNLIAKNVKIHNLNQREDQKIFGNDLLRILKDIVMKNSDVTEFIKSKNFNELTIDNLEFNESNEWKNIIRNYENAITEELDFNEDIEFLNEMQIDNLEVSGTINGINFDDMKSKWLRLEGEQIFTAPQHFNLMRIEKNLDLTSQTVNDVNLTEVIENSIWLDKVNKFEELTINGLAIVKKETAAPTVNGIILQDLLIYNATDGFQEINELTINDKLGVTYLNFTRFNGIDCEKLYKGFTDDKDQSSLHVQGNVDFQKQPKLYYLNNVELTELYNRVWISNKDSTLYGGNIQFTNNLRVNNYANVFTPTINNKNLMYLNENYFSLSKNQNINSVINVLGDGIFYKSLTTTKTLVRDSIVFDQHFPPLDISKFHAEHLMKNESQKINENWKINTLIVHGDYDGYINGIYFDDEILRNDNIETTKITGIKYFDTVESKFLQTRYVNNVDLIDWIQHTIYLNVSFPQQFVNHVKVQNAKFFNNFLAYGKVNQKEINPNTVLLRTKNEEQIITGSLYLNSTEKPIVIQSIETTDLNGRDANEWMSNSFKSSDPDIDSHLIFEKQLDVNHLETNQKIFNVDMEQFARESNASKRLENFENNLRYLRRVGENIKSSLDDPAIELNHFEYIQSLIVNDVQKVVSLMISSETFVAVHERNENADIVRFYRWNREKNLFVEETATTPLQYNFQVYEISQFGKVTYAENDYLFVEIFDKTTKVFHQNLMRLDYKSRTFVSEITSNSDISNEFFTFQSGEHSCYGTLIKNVQNIHFHCAEIPEPTLVRTSPIRMIKSLKNLFILLVAVDDNRSQIQIWKEGKFVNALNVLQPQSFTITHYKDKFLLAIISGAVEKSVHHGSIEIFESSDSIIDFISVQSFEVENPFKLQFSTIPTGDLLLYILTNQPGKALVVYVHAGASHFTKFIGEAVTIINNGIDLVPISIEEKNEKHEIVLIVSKEIYVIKAVLKEYGIIQE